MADHHEMDEDENEEMDEEEDEEEEENQSSERPSSEAWQGINLREQIKANAHLMFPNVPRAQLEIYITEHSTHFNAHLIRVDDRSGQTRICDVLSHTLNEHPQLPTPAEALYSLLRLTAIGVEGPIRLFHEASSP